MRDPEFVQLRNRFLLGVVISLCLAVPLILFFYKSYMGSSAINKINKKEDFVLLITSNDCSECKKVGDILENNDVKFSKMNVSITKDSNLVMKKLGITNNREVYPIVVYIKNGKMVANLYVENNEKEVEEFLKFHKIVG